jgi:hypothetical protein
METKFIGVREPALGGVAVLGDPLRRLDALCNTFDAVCTAASQDLEADAGELVRLGDRLWGLTGDICAEVGRLTATDGLEDRLTAYREEEFHRKFVRWYRTSPDFDRLWTKPAGYPGDYRTIETLCRGRQPASAFPDVFTELMNRFRMAEQHRAKVAGQADFMAEVLEYGREGEVSLLILGCGPCYDLRLALRRVEGNPRARIVLVDLDGEALRFAQSVLPHDRSGLRFEFIQSDALRAVRRLVNEGQTGQFDGAVTGGLFDYLSDERIVSLLAGMRRLLPSSASLLFSQVSPDNPDRVSMDWIADWRLIERDEAHLQRLCTTAGWVAERITLWRERTGCAILGRGWR